jgi:geranylgeranylglycerol-phosphate geranylgeranyltransferase
LKTIPFGSLFSLVLDGKTCGFHNRMRWCGTSTSVSLPRPSRMSSYLTLFRIPNCVMIGFAVVIGEAIALGRLPSLTDSLTGFLTAFLMMAGTMALNDVYDVETDRVNSPSRPLPSGRIGVGEAKNAAIILSALSIIFASILGIWTTLVALLALSLMVYYNARGKRTGLPGNIVVSFNVALPFFYGGVAVGSLRPLLFIFSVIAFLANLGREIAKGIPDVRGDQVLGIRTLAVSRGPKFASRVSAGLFLLAVLLSFLPAILTSSTLSLWYFAGVLLADLGFVYSSSQLLTNQNPDSVKKVKNQVLLWMLLGLVGFLLGGAATP